MTSSSPGNGRSVGVGAPGGLVDRLPIVGLVAGIAIVLVNTLAPVIHATDEMIFRNAILGMKEGRGYYPAMRDALAGQQAEASQVRSFRLPTEFLLLRPLPVSSYRWLAAAVVLISVLLCWRLARRAHPAMQAAILVGTSLWLASLLEAVYLYAEIWALPCFLAALLAVRSERWALAALALTVATCTRELYLPALVIGMVLAPAGRRKPFALGLAVAGAVGVVHHTLASEQLVERGREAPFEGLAYLADTLRALVTPRPELAIAVPVAVMTVVGVVGVIRAWRHDAAARLAGATAVVLTGATLFGGRVYWPLLFTPAVVAFAGDALGRHRRSSSVDVDPSPAPSHVAT